MEPTPNTVGRNIRQARTSAGLTQQGLAAAAAVSFQTVRNLEQGRVREPSVLTVRRIADALDCSVDELLAEETAA